MLRVLVGYVQDLGVPIRWMVITGDAEFFVITKRLHNQVHGHADGPLGGRAAGTMVRNPGPRALSEQRVAAFPGCGWLTTPVPWRRY
jgi:hypothetical protein